MAWLATLAPAARRGELLGTALGAAVAGALLGPVIGAVGSKVGTGPAFSAAAIAGGILIATAFALPKPHRTDAQGLRHALPAIRDRQIGIGMWLALIMAVNVWAIIWPNQQKALGIVAADDAAAGREDKTLKTARRITQVCTQSPKPSPGERREQALHRQVAGLHLQVECVNPKCLFT